ncbi:MAG: hypothetical protein EAZ08_04420 [Cytophagales bacterium]|nr:MAG: hypothetical protein EAZ08_04420 [Cytophagales bacterium]
MSISTLFAQNITFKVLALSGNVTADGQAVKIGSEFKSTQTLLIADDSSYIAIYYVGKKEVIEIARKGTFLGQDLAKQITAAKGWESDYFYYTIGELAQETTVLKNMGRKSVAPVMALLPTNEQKMYGTKLFFRWHTLSQLPFKEKIVLYQVMVYDTQENLLYFKDAKRQQILLDLASPKFAQHQVLLIQVVPTDAKGADLAKDYKNDTYRIGKMEQEKTVEINKEIDAIFRDRKRDTAFSKLAEARYFEDKRLPLDAMQAFEQALSLSFNAEAYKKPYRLFLERNGLFAGTID